MMLQAQRILVIASCLYVPKALAQDSNNGSTQECSGRQGFGAWNAPYNATASTSFQLPNQDPWNFTLGFTDIRDNETMKRVVQTLSVFLSVPHTLVERNNTKLCVYRMNGQNHTSDPQDNQSCAGILSEKCQKALMSIPNPTSEGCVDADVEKACGPVFAPVVTPQDLSKPSMCSDDGLPGFDLPDGYRTVLTDGSGELEYPDTKPDSFEAYDLKVQQPIPFVLKVLSSKERGAFTTETKLLCVAPRDIADGSRVAEKELPNAGNSVGVEKVTMLATTVALLAGFIVAS